MLKRFAYLILFVTAIAIGASTSAVAQRKKPGVENILNTGSQGTEFFLTIPPNEVGAYPPVGLEIYVASAFDANVELFDYAGDKSTRFKIKPYEILTLADNAKSGKPVLNWSMENRDAEIPVRKALRLRSDKPISVYVINSKQLTTDGYMAIPVNGWGTEYIPCAYSDFKEIRPWPGGFIVIAKEPTTLQILLRGQGAAQTSNGRKLKEQITVTLDEGEVYMVHGDGTTRGEFDLTGTLINADKPVGVIGFHMRTTIPNLLVNGNGRNHLCEMLPPVNTWGKRYSTLELQRARLLAGRGDAFRIVCKEPQTKWSCNFYDKTTGQLLGRRGGLLINAGDYQDEVNATQPTALVEGFSVWEANKPVFLMQYSCSSSWDGDQILDPFMFCVTPEEQYITSTIFQSPTMSQFSKHYLNLVIKTDTSDPNLIENLKSLVIDDQPVWNNGKASKPSLLFARMPNGMYHAGIEFGTDARAHRIRSNGLVSFGGYIYGFGAVDAYGWPAAAGFRPTTSVDTMPPVIKGDSLCGDYTFEATELRNIPDPPKTPPIDTDQVETGIAQIDTVEGRGSYNYRLVLITDQVFPQAVPYKRFKYEWQVIDKGKDARAIYFVADFAGNITIDTCTYFADKIAFTPNPLDFGKLRLGSNKTLTLTVTNNQDAEVKLTSSKIKLGTYFKLVSGAIPDGKEVAIPARGTYTFDIQYLGTRETTDILKDWDKDTLLVTTGCGQFKHGLTGVAAIPRIKVRDFDAGTRGLNEKYCAGLLIENPGSDTLVITTITGYTPSAFSLSAGFTPALPIIIPPKGIVELKDVCFVSDQVIDETKDVTFSSNGDGPDSVSKWTGNTQTPGPGITGYDWLKRRVGTRHPWKVKVYNTGNQEITLNDVNFATGGKYYPAGSNDNNFVFKIGNIIDKAGASVATVALKGDSADVEVFFRPDAEQIYNVEIKPVWSTTQDARTARLIGEGIIPKINSQPITLTCAETPEGDEVRRDITLTNGGTMPLTIKNITLAAGAPAGYALITAPTFPVTVRENGGTYPITVAYTRPFGVGTATTADIEVVHDATPGTGKDDQELVAVGPHTQRISVASCSSPDITTEDLDFGRNLANCDQPIKEFKINNPSGSLKPLEIKALRAAGPDAAAFKVLQVLDANSQPVAFPLILTAGQTFTVRVQFTPTLPIAAPWADNGYSAQFEIDGYAQGEANSFKTVVAKMTGVGFVVPITMNLTNDLAGSEARNPGTRVNFIVSGTSNNWASANLLTFTAEVLYDPATISFEAGTVQTLAAAPGWLISNPAVSVVSPSVSKLSFNCTGQNRIATNGPIFSFGTSLLLTDKLSAKQDLQINLGRPCLVPSTTGDSTSIFNCAISRRVVEVSSARSMISPVSPNPVSSGVAKLTFGVGISAPTTIELINAQGAVVRTLVSSKLNVGEYDLSFDTQGLAAGAYFVRMRTVEFDQTQRLMIAD
ncbi:MAG: choice-of-anchor D domain-containing protein [Candidatus Kapaibacterium sp.]